MPGLIIVAIGMSVAVGKFVSPAAQGTAFLLITLAVGLGFLLWLITGSVW